MGEKPAPWARRDRKLPPGWETKPKRLGDYLLRDPLQGAVEDAIGANDDAMQALSLDGAEGAIERTRNLLGTPGSEGDADALRQFYRARQEAYQNRGKAVAAGADIGVEAQEPGVAGKAWEGVKQAGNAISNVLDLSGRVGRTAASPLSWKEAKGPEGQDKFAAHSRQRADEGSLPHQAMIGAAKYATPLPYILGAGAAGLQAAADLTTGQLPDWERAKTAFAEGRKGGEDLLINQTVDPATVLSVGTGQAKSLVGPVMRIAKSAGMSPQQARALVTQAQRAMQAGKSQADSAARVSKVLRKAGIADDKIAATFGKQGQHMGVGQLRAEIPFTGIGVDVLPTLTRRDYGVRKLAERAHEPLREVAEKAFDRPVRGLFDHTRDTVRAAKREARASQTAIDERMNRQVAAWADPASGAPASRARREEIVGKLLDPATRKVFRTFRATLTPEESKWAGQISRDLDGWRRELVRAGVLEKGQKGLNQFSKRYVPRFQKRLLSVPDEVPAFAPVGKPKEALAKARTKDLPIGRALSQRKKMGLLEKAIKPRTLADPLEFGPEYARQASRATAQKKLERWLSDTYGEAKPPKLGGYTELNGKHVPTDLHNEIMGTFNDLGDNAAKWADNMGPVASTAWRGVYGMLRGAQQGWKRNRLSRTPAYYTNNAFGDSLMMVASGVNNLPAKMRAADRLWEGKSVRVRTPGGVTLTEKQIKQLVQKHVPSSSLHRAEISQNATERTERLRAGLEGKTAPLATRAWRAAKYGKRSPVRAWRETGEKVGDWWDSRSRTALFIDRLEKGDSAVQAAKVVRDVLIDYGERNKAVQAISGPAPFAQYAIKAPAAVAKVAARNPARVSAADKLMHSMSDREDPNEPPKFMAEGEGSMLPPAGRQVAGAARELLGGTPWREGVSAYSQHKTPFAEAFAPFPSEFPTSFEELTENAGVLKGQFGPPVQFAAELFGGPHPETGQNVNWRTGYPINEPEFGPPQRYLPGYFLSDPAILAANAAWAHLLGRENDPVLLGQPPSVMRDPQNILPEQALRMLSRSYPREVSPADELSNRRNSAAVKKDKAKAGKLDLQLKAKRRRESR